MIFIESLSNNPAFNIACEEFLLRTTSEEVLFVYRNTPAVIVGKHQAICREVNMDFVQRHNIRLVRRISGGGTVFHDERTFNYGIIINSPKGGLDFSLFSSPLLGFLKEINIDGEFVPKNSIYINGKKISGSAAHIFKNRILYHGSVLFDTDLGLLKESLKTNPLKYTGRNIPSRRSPVDTISQYTTMDTEEFSCRFICKLREIWGAKKEQRLDSLQLKTIMQLVEEKYSTPEWTFGYNANYNFQHYFLNDDYSICPISFSVHKGFISQLCVDSVDFLYARQETSRVGEIVPHETSALKKYLSARFSEEKIRKYFF